MEFWEVVENRHSIRDFRAEEVPHAVVERLLHAAALAPSAMNAQPWHYHIVTGQLRSDLGKLVAQATVHLSEYMDVLGPKRYEDAVHWYSSLGDAPVVVAVSMPRPESENDSINKLISVGASIENFMLAATAEGLGACNITFAHWVTDDLEALLGVEEGNHIVSLIALGYPTNVPPASPPHEAQIAEWHE